MNVREYPKTYSALTCSGLRERWGKYGVNLGESFVCIYSVSYGIDDDYFSKVYLFYKGLHMSF